MKVKIPQGVEVRCVTPAAPAAPEHKGQIDKHFKTVSGVEKFVVV